MKTIRINMLFSLLKVCIFSGLAVMWLTANAEETLEYAGVPSLDDCHYAEHPIIRETIRGTIHHKYRHVTHHYHHIHAHHRYYYANGLSAYYLISAPSCFGDMWPSDGCNCCMSCGGCERSGYAILPVASDDLMYNLMDAGPQFETGPEGAACDDP